MLQPIDIERVREIRSRFSDAKANGLSDAQATAYANGTGPMPKPEPTSVPVAPVAAEPEKPEGNDEFLAEEAEPAKPVQPVPAAPDYSAVPIPPEWQGLPWPHLRSLAAKVSATPINNKDDALRAIGAEARRREAKAGEAQ